MHFIAAHGLWSEAQRHRAAELAHEVEAEGIEVIRIGFADQHGIVRGKVVVASALAGILRDGLSITSSLFLKDTSHRTVAPIFSRDTRTGIDGFEGAADCVLVPDPMTFRILPWVARTGWLLCDAYFADGRAVPFATRGLLSQQTARARARGLEFITGLEIEFHLFRLLDPSLHLEDSGQPGTPPAVGLTHQGYNYLTEQRFDSVSPILDILRQTAQALGLKLRSMEMEYGPSQVEFVFDASPAIEAADDMILFRNATKQVCRRHGFHATFMCRPQIPNVCSSGWHLHQSLRTISDGGNLFTSTGEAPLSAAGMQYLAGLLRDAAAAAPFSTPTINGYKRYRPMSLAPDRAVWGVDHRGVMLRVLAGSSQAARIENRIGEPAANPYLYMASQLVSGLAGIDDALQAGPSADTPYETAALPLPTTLPEALDALENSVRFRTAFGSPFIDHLVRLKRAEVARYNAEISAWEQREYFDIF